MPINYYFGFAPGMGGVTEYDADIDLTAAGTLSADGDALCNASASLTGTASTSITASLNALAGTNLVGSSSLNVSIIATINATTSLSAATVLTPNAIANINAGFNGNSSANLVADAEKYLYNDVNLACSAILTPNALLNANGITNLSTGGATLIAAVLIDYNSVDLNVTAAITIDAIKIAVNLVNLSGISSITPNAVADVKSTTSLNGIVSITDQATIAASAATSLNSNVSLLFNANINAVSLANCNGSTSINPIAITSKVNSCILQSMSLLFESALPVIKINNDTGSNTQASGAGPNTAIYGENASINGTNIVDLTTDDPDLSGINTNGSAVLWVQAASGIQFNKIIGIDGKTIICENSYDNTEVVLWGIGGKRFDFNVDTKQLFVDVQAGWSIDIQETGDEYIIDTSILFSGVGELNNPITVYSSSNTRPVITCDVDGADIFAMDSTGYTVFDNLEFIHTGDTRGSVVGQSSGEQTYIKLTNCNIDGCLSAVQIKCENLVLESNEIQNCTSHAIDIMPTDVTKVNLDLIGNDIHDNAGNGLNLSNREFRIVCNYNIFQNNDNAVLNTGESDLRFNNNIFLDNASAIKTADVLNSLSLVNNVFYNNDIGVDLDSEVLSPLNTNNFYGSNETNCKNFNRGSNSAILSVDPFLDKDSRNFALNNLVGGGYVIRGAGYPVIFPNTTSYLDAGVVQHKVAKNRGQGTSGGMLN